MEKIQISLRAARVNAKLTIKDASKAVGVGKDTLMKWEKDSSVVDPRRQKAISLAYGIPTDNIFFGEEIERISIVQSQTG